MGTTLARLALVGALLAAGLGATMAMPGSGVRACGSEGPFDFDTYEAEKYIDVYGQAIELATAGKAVTFAYAVDGQPVNVVYQGLLSGPRAARSTEASRALTIPPTVYKSIVWIESNWGQASASVPYGGVGPVIRSFDCGYGLGQITSGMSNNSGTPSARQAVIASHFVFNLAEGVRILADKWNSAPRFRPIAGDGDSAALEDWYYATWSYNGFAFKNHPLNPGLDPLRPAVFPCGDADAPGAITYAGRSNFTYTELVYGCMAHPPKKDGVPMWAAQVFDMPHMEAPQVAAAFAPGEFLACEDGGFESGCPGMDFPTFFTFTPPDPALQEPAEDPTPTPTPEGTPVAAEIPEPVTVVTHYDTTIPINPNRAALFLGDPVLTYDGPREVVLTAGGGASLPVNIYNIGTFLAPYRIRVSQPWIVVRHANDPAGRTLDGGVAVSKSLAVVLTSTPRTTQAGYTSSLIIGVDPAQLPHGTWKGTVTIEPLLGGGGTYTVAVTGINEGGHGVSLPRRAVVGALASDAP